MEKTRQIFEFIKGYVGDRGFSPSVRDIQRALGLSSTSVVTYHLYKLELAGHITRAPGVPRSIVVVDGNGREPGKGE